MLHAQPVLKTEWPPTPSSCCNLVMNDYNHCCIDFEAAFHRHHARGTPRLSRAAIPKTIQGGHITTKPNRLQENVIWCRETKRLGHRIAHTSFSVGHRPLLAIMIPAGMERVSCGKLTFRPTVATMLRQTLVGKYLCHIRSSCMHPCSLVPELFLGFGKIGELLCLFHTVGLAPRTTCSIPLVTFPFQTFAVTLFSVLTSNAQNNQRSVKYAAKPGSAFQQIHQ